MSQAPSRSGGCRIPSCTHPNCQKTGKHYCKTCGDADSDHYSSACPKLRKASSSRARSAADSGGSDDDGNESDDSTATSSRRSRRSSGCSSGSPGGANPMMQPLIMQLLATQLLTSMMQPPPPAPAPATGAGQQDNTDQTADQNTNQQTSQNTNAAPAAHVCDPRVLAAAMLFNNLCISGQQHQQQGGDSPRHRRRSPSPRRQSCGVRGCRIDHSQHKCRRCGKINDHLTRNCTVQCRVKGCKKAHKHYCRLCGDKDSDHWATECPKGITLYHQTSAASAQAIASGRKMMRGSTGIVGGGIYFAASEQATMGKAHSPGCMIEARVYLGNSLKISALLGAGQYTHTSLKAQGYDSVHLTGMPTGDEYIVFNWAQVRLRKIRDMATGAEIPISHA
ncbi:unnamed protein product [Vitrella brassicaformis CCMP3155]|uniref:CCHC-type domain-containing protein n=1 Tax=Vitrella brassicaformis (strain CCMP3155) TaxID=1169540 RepID=A0A0G4GMD4_VITBC|nr:unnamed protein product [Vitrella brassicaformis CCMP3155]|eukprot:CEM31362.1 unnamed protein product [Vitrella brassicaformis CCMP3155]